MRILVTGGAGFVGANVVSTAVAQGYEVFNLDCLTADASLASIWHLQDAPNYQFEPVKLEDRPVLEDIIADFDPQAIIHLAKHPQVDLDMPTDHSAIAPSLDGTLTLFDVVRERLGETCPIIWLENGSNQSGPAHYVADAARRALIPDVSQVWGLDTRRIVCNDVYGPRQKAHAPIPSLILSGSERTIAPMFEPREYTLLHVTDVAEALLYRADSNQAGDVQIAGPETRPAIDIVRQVSRLAGIHGTNLSGPADAWLMNDAQPAGATKPSPLPALQGWEAKTKVDDGLAETVDWFLRNTGVSGPRVEPADGLLFRSLRVA